MSTLTIEEQAAPSTPGANKVVVYAKSDGLLYAKDDAGTEIPITGSIVINPAVTTSSGTAVTLTSTVPTWVKRINLLIDGLSTNGTSIPIIRIGDSGGIEATGYLGSAQTSATDTLFTTGFGMAGSHSATTIWHGQATLMLAKASTNTWSFSSIVGASNAAGVGWAGGAKPLSAALDRVSITTVNGTDTFDAGDITVTWE